MMKLFMKRITYEKRQRVNIIISVIYKRVIQFNYS